MHHVAYEVGDIAAECARLVTAGVEMIDEAPRAGLFGLQVNSGIFANVLWDVNAWLQLGLEGNYKLTTYDVFGDKNAWVVISQVMFRL
jgi:hypothetical protein